MSTTVSLNKPPDCFPLPSISSSSCFYSVLHNGPPYDRSRGSGNICLSLSYGFCRRPTRSLCWLLWEPEGLRFLQCHVSLPCFSTQPPCEWHLHLHRHLFSEEVADGLFDFHILRGWINISYFQLDARDQVANGSTIANHALKSRIEPPSVLRSPLNLYQEILWAGIPDALDFIDTEESVLTPLLGECVYVASVFLPPPSLLV